MIEVTVVIALAGVLMAAAVSGWQGWGRASAHDGLVTELRGVLRQAQQRAVTSGTSTCVLFGESATSADSWSVHRGRCESDTKVRLEGPSYVEEHLALEQPRFKVADDTYSAGVTFTPRGSATPGSVLLTRHDSDRVVRLVVEGLTGRVTEQ